MLRFRKHIGVVSLASLLRRTTSLGESEPRSVGVDFHHKFCSGFVLPYHCVRSSDYQLVLSLFRLSKCAQSAVQNVAVVKNVPVQNASRSEPVFQGAQQREHSFPAENVTLMQTVFSILKMIDHSYQCTRLLYSELH